MGGFQDVGFQALMAPFPGITRNIGAILPRKLPGITSFWARNLRYLYVSVSFGRRVQRVSKEEFSKTERPVEGKMPEKLCQE